MCGVSCFTAFKFLLSHRCLCISCVISVIMLSNKQFLSFMRRLRDYCYRSDVRAISEDCGKLIKIILQVYASSKSQPIHVLEIGTGWAYSTLWLAKGLIDSGIYGKVYTIEIDPEKVKVAKNVIQNAEKVVDLKGVSNMIKPVCGDAKKVIPSLKIPIDAEKEEYITYLRLTNCLLKPNALVIADNVVSHQRRLADFLTEIKNSSLWETVIIPIDEGISLSIKRSSQINAISGKRYVDFEV